MAWDPSQPWPGSPGGAWSPHWGGYVQLFVRAAIQAGNTFHLGQHDYDRLDDGNVVGAVTHSPRAAVERLWVDLACDVTELTIQAGGSSAGGVLTSVDAGTCQVTLADPDGDYDPTNADSPFVYRGRSRLVPGVPVEVFAEVVDADDSSVSTHYLFTGTADSWSEDWTPHASSRRATLLATDPTKIWSRYVRPEGGYIDTAVPPGYWFPNTEYRVRNLVSFYQWPGVIEPGPSSAAVNLIGAMTGPTGWEELTTALEAEIGMAYFTPAGALRWTSREEWFDPGPPVLALGCEAVSSDAYDVLVDASPSNRDDTMRNIVRAAGEGTDRKVKTVQSLTSIDLFGPYEYKRTDLPFYVDADVSDWATTVLQVSAYPRVVLSDVTMLPAIAPSSWELWPAVLDVRYVSDPVRIVWAPPDRPAAAVDTIGRVVGSEHKISRSTWEIKWELAVADVAAAVSSVFTLGQDDNDQLDAGNVLAF